MTQPLAKVVSLSDRHVTRAELRRAQTLQSMAVALNALRMMAEHTIPVMGDKESAEALDEVARRLAHEQQRAKSLADEFRELAATEETE